MGFRNLQEKLEKVKGCPNLSSKNNGPCWIWYQCWNRYITNGSQWNEGFFEGVAGFWWDIFSIFILCQCKALKFGLSEKHTKICVIFLMLCSLYIYLVNVQTIRKIFSNFLCFSESPKRRKNADAWKYKMLPQNNFVHSTCYFNAKTMDFRPI